ncbi:hypothetical protein AXF42_Ash017361 [Apostasia shenzhenica]|uniref:SPRY domain-containing protein n=1 Tax=Apostasia shenzhenica TaxID=1088818 RepID=A0A2I0BDJ5_9ASPA|nr:hypothetical protein AXF42_Ash017361 [Apostasia shenzhenica]
MNLWIKIIAGAIPGAAFLLLTLLFLQWRRHRQRRQHLVNPQAGIQFSETAAKSKLDTLHAGIAKLHLSRNSLRFHHLHHTMQPSPPGQVLAAPAAAVSPFNWDDHPQLIAEAVEKGWPRFAFSASVPRAPSAPPWGLCLSCDGGAPQESPDSRWEVPAESAEFMQTVRLNPGPKKTADDPSFSYVRTSLPLPGPTIAGGPFPQEAYFEITILCLQPCKLPPATSSKRVKDRESDRAKLIRENSTNGTAAPIAGVSCSSREPNPTAEGGNYSGSPAITLGLTRSSSASQSMPGTYPGSIGFSSDGSVTLEGRKLVFESEKAKWAGVSRVIGCGFEPTKKKVFFTVDSQLAHVIRSCSEEFSRPLFPVMAAANADVVVMVNMGQAPFKYAPANATRTSNPCFLRQVSVEATGVGLVDSRELFTVPRFEAEGRSKQHTSCSSKKSNLDDGIDAESDLFEIPLHV